MESSQQCEGCGERIENCICGEWETEEMPTCPDCKGTCITIEGWDCETCDGLGYLEI